MKNSKYDMNDVPQIRPEQLLEHPNEQLFMDDEFGGNIEDNKLQRRKDKGQEKFGEAFS